MGSIIFQIVGLILVLGLLAFIVRDDRRSQALRAIEDADEERQKQEKDGSSSQAVSESKQSD